MTVVAATPGLPEKGALFPDQAEAVSRVARHLRRPGTRGLYVAATGTGKTLVSIRVADELQARLVLFVVPTLDLAAQTALAWRRDGHTEQMVIVSSMDAAGRDALVAARVMSSSSPVTLATLMSVVGERDDQIPALTLICTYDSLDKIQETRNTAYAVPPFDLAIMDFTNRGLGVWDVRVEWSAGAGEGCGLGARVLPPGRFPVRRGRHLMDGRLVVGDLRVQEIVRGNGRVSYTVVDTDCTLVAEADGFLRTCRAGTDRTYAYVLVDHLRWLRFAGLDTGSVSLEHLRHYMAALGAEYPGPFGLPGGGRGSARTGTAR
ncbi:DEAD/DEAH box helicase family protein [Streptomyces atroolivaceus]|uniref:DEAD/DEAH box helicase family protein n=1 Tax=Streptomyces atroolivaceus TaxID=66869 RepID=A0ABV9VKP0_STRAZ|nr:DEAD/DEAH box helicase family protein [Streptomyces atroolivaceus]